MQNRHKAYIIFSLIYWLVVIAGVILFLFAFQKVPINNYALRLSIFTSHIDLTYYLPGLYHTGIGYYFLPFPKSKVYLRDQRVEAINKDY